VDFTNVSIERRKEGRVIKTDHISGWGWDELADVQNGEARAQSDALRLLAVFLNHWDNRPANQRLICLHDGSPRADDGCPTPLAYIQDAGATFGYVGGHAFQRKLDLQGWRDTPIWKNPARCVVQIHAPRFHGATFHPTTISESGRAFLASRLSRLNRSRIRDLFEGAHFDDYRGGSPASRNIDRWVDVFEQVGALVMLVVGASLARAFGIVGAASLVRYRSKIDDPKDAGVMLSCLAIGLASGVGIYWIAGLSTLFILAVVWVLESQEPEDVKDFLLNLKAKDLARVKQGVERTLARNGVKYELRASSPEDLMYSVRMPLTKRTDRITSAIRALDPDPQLSVEWSDKKPGKEPA
jgi:hypothetical protein